MQARMGSSRLPGKILMEAGGKTFLEHAFQRLSLTGCIDQCVVATTTDERDDVVADFCSRHGWPCSRGPEHDVLTRYHETANRFPADIIIRVTADCPLLDPSLINQVVELLAVDFPGTAYASNTLDPRHFPRGLDVEAFTSAALEEAYQCASEPSDREHVTPFLRERPEQFPRRALSIEDDYSSHRWTLDTPEDQQLLSRILEHLPNPEPWEKILSLVEDNPEWSKLNATIRQKA